MVTRFADLVLLVNRYALLSEASLRSDMAKRIMYSILPGVAGPTQTMATQGIVDYNALKAAVEGRKDIIKYGVKAAVAELSHYDGSLSSSELGVSVPTALARGRPYHIAQALAAQGNNEAAMDIAIKLFDDEEGWPPAYGGAAWLRIAKSLKHTIELDKNLEAVRASRGSDPDYMDKEMNIMQQLVVEMNVFDGLSHNTASVMEKLVMEEAHAKPESPEGRDLESEIATEFNSIQRMMDAKELRNPVQVYREIEPTLVESGDINRYKDWTSPLRRDPSYRAEDPNLEAEKFQIRLRKQITPLRVEINTRRDFMRKSVERILTAGPESLMNIYRILDTKVEEFANIVDRLIQLIDDQYFKPIPEAEFAISDTLRAGPVAKLRDGLSKLSMKARYDVEVARHKIAPILQKYTQQKKKGVILPATIKELQAAIYEVMKLIYEGYGSLAFYLDSI